MTLAIRPDLVLVGGLGFRMFLFAIGCELRGTLGNCKTSLLVLVEIPVHRY